MHREKIDHFYKFRTSASEEFPTFRSLSEAQCAEVRTNLQQRFAFLKGLDGKKMGDAIFATGKPLSNVNAEDESFTVGRALSLCGVKLPVTIYLDWSNFDQIDELAFKDLETYFSDIWWPGPDDIILFDDSNEWILSIDHSGFIGILKV